MINIAATGVFVFFLVIFSVYSLLLNKYWKKKIKQVNDIVKDTEAQLIHMEKMASLGTLAAGIAHEVNNPLSFLISNLDSLKGYFMDMGAAGIAVKDKNIPRDEFVAMAQESLDGALRIKKIVSDLRTFSRRSETQDILVDINQVMESVLSIVWNEIKYKITVVKDYQAKSSVMGDPTQLSQVFLNIIINASQAIADRGTISLFTYEDDKDVCIKISDTGTGITPEVLSKIFDPFFSTKKSTGLGLSVSYNIIKKHGGEIKVESKVGCGTTFIVMLPKKGGG